MLSGNWGGDRANLKVGIDESQVEFDCGTAMIEGRLQVDAQGAFSGVGYFEDFAGGPVNPDLPPKRRPTMFRGQVSDDILDLTIEVSGEAEPRRLRLVRDHRVKLLRCF